MKNIFKMFGIFLLLFFISFIFSFFCWNISVDEIWNYGFGYNIANGLVPYRDFNMIVTPLYSILLSFFINWFGHHLYVMYIFNAIMVAIMLLIIYYRIGYKVILLAPVVLLYSFPGYNSLSLFLMIILISICDKKLKNLDFILGIIIGFIFLTKQTVGIFVLIPFIYFSKNKIKGIISFLIPIFVFGLYIIYNDALYEFVDYCFLSILDFSSSNKVLFFLPIELVIVVFMIYKLIKVKFQDKLLCYVLMYQVIMIPIFDFYHFVLCVTLIGYLLLLKIDMSKYKIKYYFCIISFSCIYLSLLLNNFYSNYHLYTKKDSYLYGRYVGKFVEDNIEKISSYVNDKEKYYDKVYLFTCNSYQIKLNIEMPINKFDLINNGNMGYNGYNRYINEINGSCDNSKCLFLLYRFEFYDDKESENRVFQTNQEIINYVKNNYVKIDNYADFYIYSN